MQQDTFAPSSESRFPLAHTKRIVFLKSVLSGPNISAGEYSYYDDPDNPESFQEKNVLYHYDFVGDRLDIGKYCALGTGTKFIMNGANHRMDGPSTFPFPIFGEAWAEHMDLLSNLPSNGDTTVGHDVWFGYGATIMPGVKIGNGAIVATGAVVTQDVPPYAIIGGNPAKVIRYRFDETTIARLLELAWWHWPLETVTQNIKSIMAGTVAELAAVSP